MNNARKTDALLRRALGSVEAPDPALLRQVKASLGKEQDMKANQITKRMITLVLAAALLLALSVTAYAALERGWFENWFAQQAGEELSESITDYIAGHAVDIGQSVTADGWTVTLRSVMTDGQYFFVTLGILPPEGIDRQRLNPVLSGEMASLDPAAPDFLVFRYGQLIPPGGVCDGDGVYVQMMEKVAMDADWDRSVDLSYPLVLTLDRLENGYAEPELLSAGPWRFVFTVTPAAREQLELTAREPFAVTAELVPDGGGELTRDPYTHVLLDAATGLPAAVETVQAPFKAAYLRPLGAELVFSHRGPELSYISGWELEVELTGGRRARLWTDDAGYDPDEGVYWLDMQFAAPIDLDEVVSVSFQGHELALPD